MPKATAKKTAAAPKREHTLDFDSLVAEDVEASEVKHRRETYVDRSPVIGWLEESWTTGNGKSVKLPNAEAAKEFAALVRTGATRFENMGTKITETANEDGTVTVRFIAKQKGTNGPRKNK